MLNENIKLATWSLYARRSCRRVHEQYFYPRVVLVFFFYLFIFLSALTSLYNVRNNDVVKTFRHGFINTSNLLFIGHIYYFARCSNEIETKVSLLFTILWHISTFLRSTDIVLYTWNILKRKASAFQGGFYFLEFENFIFQGFVHDSYNNVYVTNGTNAFSVSYHCAYTIYYCNH